ncbi:MAG: sigma-70 family RNA polymerase sigma factor [Candidatus Dormibacteraeota bacterium]|nr:sigma-70 family RNA polymerase sigma factor [Candidatus Dormibacteraeota bacterium]
MDRVYRYVYARIGNRPEAEEITSQVFLHALPHVRVQRPEQAREYLLVTARTLIADHWRHRQGAVVVEATEASAAPEDDVASPEDGRSEVDGLLARLSASHREVLELRFLRGYSIRETALEMGITVTNAKQMQLRALRKAAELNDADVASTAADGEGRVAPQAEPRTTELRWRCQASEPPSRSPSLCR